jgi:hypothetical protein
MHRVGQNAKTLSALGLDSGCTASGFLSHFASKANDKSKFLSRFLNLYSTDSAFKSSILMGLTKAVVAKAYGKLLAMKVIHYN